MSVTIIIIAITVLISIRALSNPVMLQKWMMNEGWLDKDHVEEHHAEVKAKVLAALKEAEKVPAPHIDELINDVYDEPTPLLKEQLEELKEHIRKYPDAYPKTSGRID